jgi:transposase
MQDRTLYARLLGIEDPWRASDVTLRLDEEQAVVVSVEMDPGAALFEALVIDWLKEASFSAVARQLSLSQDQVAGIQERAVRRGLARREKQRPRCIGVDEVRRAENRELVRQGDNRLKKTKYLWLTNPDRMSSKRWQGFASLRDSPLRVARAWAIKYYWDGVINAATTDVTNARSEGLNSKIQWVKRMACGYRNRRRFHNAIYFHLGDLNLYPDSLKSAHTTA